MTTSNSADVLPRRVLVVDDDPAVRDSVADVLRAANIEAVVAGDGEEALTVVGRRWFPVVVTDRNMPVQDGIEFVSRLRAMAVFPVYVIMLSASADAMDLERGYCAGVDHYVPKKGYDAELLAKVNAGMAAIRRRQQAQTSPADRPVTIDLENGAHTARHLVGLLHSEIQHARRNAKPFFILSACIEIRDITTPRGIETASAALLQAAYAAARPKLDWVARLPASRQACRIAVVMPEADLVQIAAIQQSIQNAFVHSHDAPALRGMQLTMGVATLYSEGEKPTALGLLGEAERQRRGLTRLANVVGAVQGNEGSTAGEG